MPHLRKIAAAFALLIALSACSGGGNGNGSGNAAGKGTASPAASTAPTVNPFATPTKAAVTPTPEASGTHLRPCEAVIYYSSKTGVPGRDYIRAVTRPPIRWGPGCEVLTPGESCTVQWDGHYVVLAGDEAYLTFQGWAKGESKPFKEITAGPLPAENSLRRAGFPIVVPNAPEVAFRIVVLNQAKKPVVISDSYSYKVNCRPE